MTVAGGTPTLTLNDGGTATYTGGSGSSALTFSYTVAAGQNTADLAATAVNLNAATVTDAAGNTANLAGALTNPAGTLQIDTTLATPQFTVSLPETQNAANDQGAANSATFVGTAVADSTVIIYDGTTQLGIAAVNGSGAWSFATGTLTDGTYSFSVQDTDAAGDISNMSAAQVLTVGGTHAVAGHAPGDASAPTVSSVVGSPSSGDLDAGNTVTLTLTLTEMVTVAGGTPTLTLNDGGTATYTGGSGSDALTFSYTVAAGQNTADLSATAVNLNAATVTDSAGNAASLSLTGLTQSGPQIDTTPPTAPVIASDAINTNNTVTLSGTAEADSTVTVYDGQAALGTATANASGAWTYTTATLASGPQVITAVATDAAGNTSAASIALDPIVGELTGVQAGTRSVADGAALYITGTFNNTGTVALNGTSKGADLAVDTSVTLTGGGKVTLSNIAGNAIGSDAAPSTLNNVNNTIAGAGTIGDKYLTLINQGTINANGSLALVLTHWKQCDHQFWHARGNLERRARPRQ